jgi:hypothetical protein
MLRTLVFLSLITSAHASLDDLVNAAQSFAAVIDRQITIAQSDPSPAFLAENTVAYAAAKISYFNALRAAMPELTDIATGRAARTQEVDKFRDAFHIGSEIQEIAADKRQQLCCNATRSIPTSRKRLRNFTRRKKSKSVSIRTLTDKIWRGLDWSAAVWQSAI